MHGGDFARRSGAPAQASLPGALAAYGITDGSIRLSIGVEAVDDILADLLAGLDRMAMPAPGQRCASRFRQRKPGKTIP